jgi:predicted hotdog family 3-hydroxylacyl-ACP dehydratase
MSLEENMLNLIPQRPPFVMVGNLLHSDEKLTRTSFLVREDNIFVENGELKEPGLIENIAQTAAAGAGYKAKLNNNPVAVGYIGAVKNLEIFAMPKINDELITEVTICPDFYRDDVTIISGKSWCNEKLMAQCEMKIFIGNSTQITG